MQTYLVTAYHSDNSVAASTIVSAETGSAALERAAPWLAEMRARLGGTGPWRFTKVEPFGRSATEQRATVLRSLTSPQF